jgi:hypothetical protein
MGEGRRSKGIFGKGRPHVCRLIGWYLCNALHDVLEGSNPDKLWALHICILHYTRRHDQARLSRSASQNRVYIGKKIAHFKTREVRWISCSSCFAWHCNSPPRRFFKPWRHAPPSRPSTLRIPKRWLYRRAPLVTRLGNGANILHIERQGCSRSTQHLRKISTGAQTPFPRTTSQSLRPRAINLP